MAKNAKRSKSSITYRATFVEIGEVIYAGRPYGNLIDNLPSGAFPTGGTFLRKDGGDLFEAATGVTPSGRKFVIERERRS